jgi:hypothetical protein
MAEVAAFTAEVVGVSTEGEVLTAVVGSVAAEDIAQAVLTGARGLLAAEAFGEERDRVVMAGAVALTAGSVHREV